LRASVTGIFHRINLAPAVLIIAAVSFVAHVLVGDSYGYYRDELYLMAMSQHPAFGYVDVQPLAPWITLIPRFLTGNALWAIHVISALVCVGIILLTGLMATALALLAEGSQYGYDLFDEFWWALGATILIVLLREEEPRWWLAFADPTARVSGGAGGWRAVAVRCLSRSIFRRKTQRTGMAR
jgi:hypothetical protein